VATGGGVLVGAGSGAALRVLRARTGAAGSAGVGGGGAGMGAGSSMARVTSVTAISTRRMVFVGPTPTTTPMSAMRAACTPTEITQEGTVRARRPTKRGV
jgi:hypothetical protein